MMLAGLSQAPAVRGRFLAQTPLAAAVAQRALQVGELLAKRRKVALAYRRTQSEDERLALAQLDQHLSHYNIDIPAIERRSRRC